MAIHYVFANSKTILSAWSTGFSLETTQNKHDVTDRISVVILANNQLDVLFHVFIYFISLHVSSITELIIRRSKYINTSSGMISLCKWLLGMPVLTGIPSSHLHRLIIPDDVLIQFYLLMMSAVMLETCRQLKQINEWKSASSWLLARICNKMHG